MGQVANRFHDLSHDGFRALVRVLQQNREPADALDQRGHVRLPKALFEQLQISLPVTELTTMGSDAGGGRILR